MRVGSTLAMLAGLLLLGACESAGTADETAVTEAVTADSHAPPPPPATASMSESFDTSVDEVAVTGSRVAGAESAPERTVPSPARPRPQSGTLTAADHDDLLNPGLYADFVDRFRRSYGGVDAPELDTARRVTVAVTGVDGRPIHRARIRLTRADGSNLSRTTATDGTVVLHPALDGLPERVRMIVAGPEGGASIAREFAVTPARRATTVAMTLPIRAAPARALDLLLVVDATGSMGDEMEFLKSELADIVTATARANPGLQTRVGLTVYRDIGDEYVVRNFPLTGDVAALVRSLDGQSAGGGGDYPEAVDQALESALQANWDPRAVKALVLVADAPPHDERAPVAWRNAMALRDQGVHIVPVAASGVGPAAEYLMRAMAAATQSRYLFLTDDSGVGNAHGEPAVDCYVVTRLDGLLRRVLTGLVVGRRIEPAPGEVLREVGDYDAGLCRGIPLAR